MKLLHSLSQNGDHIRVPIQLNCGSPCPPYHPGFGRCSLLPLCSAPLALRSNDHTTTLPPCLFFCESCCAWSFGRLGLVGAPMGRRLPHETTSRQTRAGARLVASLGTPHRRSLAIAGACPCEVHRVRDCLTCAIWRLWLRGTPHSRPFWVWPVQVPAYLDPKTPAFHKISARLGGLSSMVRPGPTKTEAPQVTTKTKRSATGSRDVPQV